MEQKVCPICGKTEDSGALLLDTRLRNRFERNTTTGMGLCKEHKQLHEDGYIALVEVDPSKSDGVPGGALKPEQAWRTGRVAHVRRSAWDKIFNVPLDPKLPMVYLDIEGFDKIAAMHANMEN
jgi:hypothetical protein